MSKLKAFYMPRYAGAFTMHEVYLKSEADKVIEEKDYEIKNLKDSINKLLKANTEQIIHEVVQKTLIYGEGFIRVQDAMKLIAELRHNKYKRCLAMADYSMYHHFRMLEIYGKRLDNDRAVFKINFGLKWLYRWLKLAEKFKPNNSTAQ